MKEIHKEHMQLALSIAKQAKYIASPNPMVGAVIVKNNKIIGKGYTHKPGQDHAEIDAIKNVKKRFKETSKSKLEGSSLYVTLEPCSRRGRTPACTEDIIEASIKKVFIATKDPSQKGIEVLKKAGIKIEIGLCQKSALSLNKGFFMRMNKKRPFVTCKIACSLDGGVALLNGESKWITSNRSRLDAHKLRASSDAIMTGIGTVLADNPQMTARLGTKATMNLVNQPTRLVVDSHLKLKGDENLVIDDFETTIFCYKEKKLSYINSTIKIIEIPGQDNKVSLTKVMNHLHKEKCNYLLIESGPTLITSLIEQQFIDEFVIYIAPKLLGKNKINFTQMKSSLPYLSTISLEIQEITESGSDIKLVAKANYHKNETK